MMSRSSPDGNTMFKFGTVTWRDIYVFHCNLAARSSDGARGIEYLPIADGVGATTQLQCRPQTNSATEFDYLKLCGLFAYTRHRSASAFRRCAFCHAENSWNSASFS
jgi:hypothetical protein